MEGGPTWVVEWNSCCTLVLNYFQLPFQEVFQCTEHVWRLVCKGLKRFTSAGFKRI